MAKPNFFIVGAPKCGTTSLLAYLRKHPQIYAPGLREFNHIADDLTWVSDPVVTSDEEYLSHFQGAGGYKRIGEKSAFYLYSERAPHRIHELNPAAKIICMFRDPVDVMWSLYRYHVQALREDIHAFKEALEAENLRKQGQCIPDRANFVEDFYYRDIVRFADQLQRYVEVFGWECIHVILFRDFVSNTDEVYRETLRFLEVPVQSLPRYESHNTGHKLINLGLRRYLEEHPSLKRLKQAVPLGLRHKLKPLAGRLTGGEPDMLMEMDADVRRKLNEEFRPETKKLETLIGRDLSHWCRDGANA